MNRTRVVFFSFVALFLALIVVGLLVQGLSAQFVQQIFVATAIFGGGVVILDMLGLLGHHAADVQDGGALVGHATIDTGVHAGGDAGDAGVSAPSDAADGGAGGHADGAGQGDAAGHAGGDHQGDAAQPAHAGRAQEEGQLNQGLLSALVYLRLLVYFCLGFGPMGWAAMGSGWGALRALALAAPVGVAVVFLAQAFFRFQRKDTDSQMVPAELVAQDAIVLVALDDKTMGKVRVQVGMNVSDLYALASRPGQAYEKGRHVRIVRVTDECVFVG